MTLEARTKVVEQRGEVPPVQNLRKRVASFSAGVAIATTIASLLFDKPVRNDLAMTGEITLTGRVLPIGGLKDKVIAAHRAGIRTIILPRENKRDLDEIPDSIKEELTLIPVSRAGEAIERALIWD